jgi:hypothetical protein
VGGQGTAADRLLNNEVQRISDQMTLGDHDALREYFTAALCASRGSFR